MLIEIVTGPRKGYHPTAEETLAYKLTVNGKLFAIFTGIRELCDAIENLLDGTMLLPQAPESEGSDRAGG